MNAPRRQVHWSSAPALGRFFGCLLLPIAVPANFLDEMFHITAALLLGVQVDWSNTQLFGLRAWMSHYAAGHGKSALISGAAPFGWLMTGTASWACLRLFPERFGFEQFHAFDRAAFIAGLVWYLAVMSVLMLLANLLFGPRDNQDSMTDLQRFLISFRKWRRRTKGPQTIERLPSSKEIDRGNWS